MNYLALYEAVLARIEQLSIHSSAKDEISQVFGQAYWEIVNEMYKDVERESAVNQVLFNADTQSPFEEEKPSYYHKPKKSRK